MPNVIEDLLHGYQSFRKEYFEDHPELYGRLFEQGQSPKVLVIACSDSRVDPAIITNCKPGDLFVVRNVANLVPPYEDDSTHHGTTAAIQYAVCVLGVDHIVVLGHSQCGGIQTLLRGGVADGPIKRWLEIAEPVKEQLSCCSNFEEKVHECSRKSILHSLENLKTFPWLQERVQQQEITLHGWYFDLESGTLFCANDSTGQFESAATKA